MHLFNLNLILFDQEDYQELDKMNNIEVNIYLSNSNTIRELSDSAKEQINNFISPGRRNEMLKRQKLIQAQTLNKFENESPLFTESRTILSGKSRRIYSTKSHFRTNNKSGNSYSNKKLALNNSNKSYDIFSSNNSGPSSDINGLNRNEYKYLKSQRGQLIKKQFSKINPNLSKEEYYDSSESVSVQFNLLPYDTYIVETKENCYFQSSITLLKFNEINAKDSGNVTKYIGLWHQQKAILNIHLYKEIEVEKKPNIYINNENNENANNENQNIKTVEQIPITSGTITISDADDPNSRYQVYSNSKGIYEYKTQPGEYKLEVYTKDFERDVRKIKLKCGLNTINIKLNPDKNCELEIEVLEYNESINDENDNENKNNMELIPVRNASVQIFKNSQELLMEGITNKKGLMKYFVDKNDNNLSIKITKDGYFRAERFFKKNSNMKENEIGNYDCIMTFVLVKKEILQNLNKILFVLYTNMSKKIFDLEIQKYDKEDDDEQLNHYYINDMQKKSGILIASLWYKPQKREEDEVILEEHLNQSSQPSKKREITVNKDNQENGNQDEVSNEEDYNEETYYKEIVRLGLTVDPSVISDSENFDSSNVSSKDLIEYLRDICCEGNIYTPSYDFHINLPKLLSENIITERNEEINFVDGGNNDENLNMKITNKSNSKVNNSGSKTSSKKKKIEFKGLYWDLGWLDLINHLYYETSCNFHFDYKPDRLTFFEKFLEFLQVFIDKKLYDSLFSFFNFDNSVLAGSDRYLPKKVFCVILNEMLIDENKNSEIMDEESYKQNKEKMDEKQNFIQFICNIMCGYDEELNIRDDSISYNLLKKKISSNLKNFNEIKETIDAQTSINN